jgi:hypothetical protein
MQVSKHLSLYDTLLSLGISGDTADQLIHEYKRECLREPETLGDLLEVLE